MIKDILSFSEELTLWGSKKVADKWVKFRLNGANPEAAKNNLFLLESIMNEMRNDMSVKRVKNLTQKLYRDYSLKKSMG